MNKDQIKKNERLLKKAAELYSTRKWWQLKRTKRVKKALDTILNNK
jgi:hypothetical protein